MVIKNLGEDLNRIRDFWWTFILPSICLGGICANFINIIILVKLRNKNLTYRLMLYNSISNLFYTFICSFVFIMRCGKYCQFQNTWMACVYEKYFYFYFSGVLGMFNVLIEIMIAIQRYFIAANKKFTNESTIKALIIVIIIFSLCAYTPIIITRDILELDQNKVALMSSLIYNPNNFTLYYIKNNIGEYVPLKIIYSGFIMFRSILVLLLLVFINILLLNKFDDHVSKKTIIKTKTGIYLSINF
jgi:hypothetical protein